MKLNTMIDRRHYFAVVALTALSACGSGEAIDSRAVLMASCETSQGIGWL